MIYLGTRTAPPPLPSGQYPPGTALLPLRAEEAPVRDKFSLPHVSSIKLNEGCGCWLRYVDSDDSEHPPDFELLSPKEGNLEQPNHDSLADYLQTHFRQDGFVEFFGYFYGNAAQPARAHQEVPVDAIRSGQFQFHGRTLYRLTFD